MKSIEKKKKKHIPHKEKETLIGIPGFDGASFFCAEERGILVGLPGLRQRSMDTPGGEVFGRGEEARPIFKSSMVQCIHVNTVWLKGS